MANPHQQMRTALAAAIGAGATLATTWIWGKIAVTPAILEEITSAAADQITIVSSAAKISSLDACFAIDGPFAQCSINSTYYSGVSIPDDSITHSPLLIAVSWLLFYGFLTSYILLLCESIEYILQKRLPNSICQLTYIIQIDYFAWNSHRYRNILEGALTLLPLHLYTPAIILEVLLSAMVTCHRIFVNTCRINDSLRLAREEKIAIKTQAGELFSILEENRLSAKSELDSTKAQLLCLLFIVSWAHISAGKAKNSLRKANEQNERLVKQTFSFAVPRPSTKPFRLAPPAQKPVDDDESRRGGELFGPSIAPIFSTTALSAPALDGTPASTTSSQFRESETIGEDSKSSPSSSNASVSARAAPPAMPSNASSEKQGSRVFEENTTGLCFFKPHESDGTHNACKSGAACCGNPDNYTAAGHWKSDRARWPVGTSKTKASNLKDRAGKRMYCSECYVTVNAENKEG